MVLGPPATRVECYLAAIHDRLGEILDRLGGGQVQEPAPPADTATLARPTKRTRTRPPRTAA